MAKKRFFAEEGGGVGRSTLFPSVSVGSSPIKREPHAEDKGKRDMEQDLVTLVCRDLGYNKRQEREMRLLGLLHDGGWRSGTEERVKYVRSLSDRALNWMSSAIVLGQAQDILLRSEDTLIEKLGFKMHGHSIDGDGVLSDGIMHEIQDGGRPFGSDAFKEQWEKRSGIV